MGFVQCNIEQNGGRTAILMIHQLEFRIGYKLINNVGYEGGFYYSTEHLLYNDIGH